ncbi:hypothetical protein K1719_011295 [Acacia pycnantha]|nr:hypothetical protein K1719_011295 [Acacia pycnantha]
MAISCFEPHYTDIQMISCSLLVFSNWPIQVQYTSFSLIMAKGPAPFSDIGKRARGICQERQSKVPKIAVTIWCHVGHYMATRHRILEWPRSPNHLWRLSLPPSSPSSSSLPSLLIIASWCYRIGLFSFPYLPRHLKGEICISDIAEQNRSG